jgi:hypothetical protein
VKRNRDRQRAAVERWCYRVVHSQSHARQNCVALFASSIVSVPGVAGRDRAVGVAARRATQNPRATPIDPRARDAVSFDFILIYPFWKFSEARRGRSLQLQCSIWKLLVRWYTGTVQNIPRIREAPRPFHEARNRRPCRPLFPLSSLLFRPFRLQLGCAMRIQRAPVSTRKPSPTARRFPHRIRFNNLD